VTIVVVPRDHFSDAKESLESLFAFTPPRCPIVYVDGNSPPGIARYLREQAKARDFELLRCDHYLTPNQARNIGARRAKTRYVVFVDNDVIVAPGWLPALVECADSTDAAVVGPLNYERKPVHQTVHFAGGETRIVAETHDGITRNRLVDRIHKEPVPADAAMTDAAEFHCMLVRSDVFWRLGGLDEGMLSTRENIDFCLALQRAGERIYLEPRAKITYLPPDPLRLDEDEYFQRQYRNLGWRRRELMMRGGLLRWLVSYRVRGAAERLLRPIERRVNAMIARRHAKRYGVPLRFQ
jgi:GT2 family glycosyltransferase